MIDALLATDDLPRPRLLACDIDGTILDPTGRLRHNVRDALRAVAASGVHVILATGRAPWDGIAELADELGLQGPQITMQGALLSDPRTGQVERLRPLPPLTFLDGLRFADELGLDPVVGLIDGHRAVRLAPEADFVVAGTGPARYRPEDDLRHLAHSTPVRLFLPTGPARHRHVRAAASVWFARNATVVWSDDAGIELLGPGTDKGSALAWMASTLGITRDEVAAVGDGPNDMALLRYAARTAAMGGAPDELTRLADVVVANSDDDGILSALAWFFPDLARGLDHPLLPPIELDRYRLRRAGRENPYPQLVG